MIDALPLLLGPEGYQISRSVRLRSSASAYFSRTLTTPTDGKRWTWSGWAKLGAIATREVLFAGASGTNVNYISIDNFTAANANFGLTYANSGVVANVGSTNLLRDPSAWYHLMVAYDSTSATSTITGSATDRVRLYINGVQVTAFAASTAPALNATLLINAANAHAIGRREGINDQYFDGYLTEINFIDGQALTPASFGETNAVTGVWQPKKYTGTYGTNGFYLNFSDNSAATAAAIGKDYSGNGNNWTPNNISVTSGATYDSMLDVPTQWADGGNGRGNYCVLNPLKNTASISRANLQTVNAASAGYYTTYATASMDSGKYYWEIVATDDGVNARYSGFGIADPSIALTGSTTSAFTGTQAGNARGWTQAVRSSISVYSTGLFNNGASVNTTTRATTSGTRIFMVAYDADSGKCWMGYEGTWWTGDPAAGTSQYFTATAPMMPVFNPYNDGSNSTLIGSVNFGQRPFAYTPPSGFKALNTLNLPTPTILKGNQYFDVALQTGNTTGRTVSGLAFQPDLVIVKNRAGSTNRRWGVIDSVRGVNKTLSTALTDAEVTSQTDLLTAFNSDGFTIGADAGLYGWNGFAESYAHFIWKEGATQGFDIAAFTAPASGNFTVAHSLGVAPAMFILKSRSYADGWYVYHKNLATPASNYLTMNATSAVATSTSIWGNTAPTSSVVTLGAGAGIAGSATGILYLFAEVAGFSRFGSYTGNGSADGPFVFCGFRPRWLMTKRIDSSTSGDWNIVDTARGTYNVVGPYVYANQSAAEGSAAIYDILSNGFKIRESGAGTNASGSTYIFAAFAEVPFRNALAR